MKIRDVEDSNEGHRMNFLSFLRDPARAIQLGTTCLRRKLVIRTGTTNADARCPRRSGCHLPVALPALLTAAERRPELWPGEHDHRERAEAIVGHFTWGSPRVDGAQAELRRPLGCRWSSDKDYVVARTRPNEGVGSRDRRTLQDGYEICSVPLGISILQGCSVCSHSASSYSSRALRCFWYPPVGGGSLMAASGGGLTAQSSRHGEIAKIRARPSGPSNAKSFRRTNARIELSHSNSTKTCFGA